VAVGPKAVWVADGAKVVRIDPATLHAATPITLRFAADQLAVGDDGTVWVTHTADDAVSRIDAADGSVQTIEDVGQGPTGIAVGEGAAWVAVSDGRELVRIDLGSRRVDRRIPLGSSPGAVAVADRRVWVTTQAASG
jgi:DNA-binding beta-propeller fold protein YncE